MHFRADAVPKTMDEPLTVSVPIDRFPSNAIRLPSLRGFATSVAITDEIERGVAGACDGIEYLAVIWTRGSTDLGDPSDVGVNGFAVVHRPFLNEGIYGVRFCPRVDQ